jgi:hypothetical protein
MNAVLSSERQDEAEIERQAYNSAFDELGLSWHWDRATYASLPPGREGLRLYIERDHPHLLKAYEPGFLVDAVETARSRCQIMLRRA